jgi:hypothetical protein
MLLILAVLALVQSVVIFVCVRFIMLRKEEQARVEAWLESLPRRAEVALRREAALLRNKV